MVLRVLVLVSASCDPNLWPWYYWLLAVNQQRGGADLEPAFLAERQLSVYQTILCIRLFQQAANCTDRCTQPPQCRLFSNTWYRTETDHLFYSSNTFLILPQLRFWTSRVDTIWWQGNTEVKRLLSTGMDHSADQSLFLCWQGQSSVALSHC